MNGSLLGIIIKNKTKTKQSPASHLPAQLAGDKNEPAQSVRSSVIASVHPSTHHPQWRQSEHHPSHGSRADLHPIK
ncbi:hypothetical protein VTJ04DRAFT_9845 [Mycothermus thermophilus]|uniref:uncharacterized protein n=1 Tax=Humicola insolens TaxID=85995 RepID=UPI003742BBD5